MRGNKGITLIIVVLTVVILAILVLLSIDLVVNKKLFSKSKTTVEKANNQLAQDQNIENSLLEDWDETTGKSIKTGTKVPPCKEHNYKDGTCTRCGEKEPLKPGVKTTENTEYTDAKGKKSIIPGGFTISKADGEKTVDNGLVIYLINDKTEEEIKAINWNDEATLENLKKTYDQFVWIPVQNVNKMFMCQSKAADDECNLTLVNDVPTCTVHHSTQMAGRLYATDAGDKFNSSLKIQTYNANSDLREPAKLSSTDSGYVDQKEETNLGLQAEYNNAVKKVIESKGFWVGRYETSEMSKSSSSDSTSILSVVAGKGASDGINMVNWYRMYKQQQNYANKKDLDTSKIQSTMIFGAAWDQTMLFANCANETTPEKDYSAVITGNVKTDCYKNIYDLCGNLVEETTEAYNTEWRVFRGRPAPRK